MIVEEVTPELTRDLGILQEKGLVVVAVDEDTPAAEADFRAGDLVLEVDQIPIRGINQFNQKIEGYKTGDTILFLIQREGKTLFLTLKVWG